MRYPMYLVFMSNAFGTADDILITEFGHLGRDHDETLSRQSNLKLNMDKCPFRCTSIPF